MLGLQKIFLLVRFFNWIFCNKGLKAKISRFFTYFFYLTPLRLEYSRSKKTASFLTSHRLKKYRNLHPLHGASPMERKRDKYWKSPIFEGKLRVFISYLSEMKKSVYSIILLYSSTVAKSFRYNFIPVART